MSKYRKRPVVVEAYQTDQPIAIETLEGTMRADIGDWIITGVKGEQYPCKPDIFKATYEPAEERRETVEKCKADRLDAICEWHVEMDGDDDHWMGSCGADWIIFEGHPIKNEMNYCPKCGRRLVERESSERIAHRNEDKGE